MAHQLPCLEVELACASQHELDIERKCIEIYPLLKSHLTFHHLFIHCNCFGLIDTVGRIFRYIVQWGLGWPS